MLTAAIITIGDELLIGQVVDTNSAYMAQRLCEWGISLHSIISVHDDAKQIIETVDMLIGKVDIILMTGGLGPTKDDITKHVLTEHFGGKLVYRPEIHEHLQQWYAQRPDVLNRLTEEQCLFPDNATLIPNAVGSAQVMMWKDVFKPKGKECIVISMPGVPREMEYVMQHGVGDALRMAVEATAGNHEVTHRTIRVTGIAESSLAIILDEWETALPNEIRLAYLPKSGVIRLRLSAYGIDHRLVDEQAQQLITILKNNNIQAEAIETYE